MPKDDLELAAHLNVNLENWKNATKLMYDDWEGGVVNQTVWYPKNSQGNFSSSAWFYFHKVINVNSITSKLLIFL